MLAVGGAAARLLIQQAGPRWLARLRPAVGIRSPGAVKDDGDRVDVVDRGRAERRAARRAAADRCLSESAQSSPFGIPHLLATGAADPEGPHLLPREGGLVRLASMYLHRLSVYIMNNDITTAC